MEYKQEPINNQVFKQIQNEEGLSNRSVERIQANIRKNLGQSSVQSGLHQELRDDPKDLEKFFKTEKIPFDLSGEVEKVTKKLCYCKDIPAFTNYVKESRDFADDADLKVGIDGGGGFFKVTLNLTEKTQLKPEADDLNTL